MKPEKTFHSTLSEALRYQATNQPDAPALSLRSANNAVSENWISYQGLNERVDEIAAVLRERGVTRGVRVAVRLQKSIDVMALFLGVLRSGGIYVPINPNFVEREIISLVTDSMPALLIDNTPGDLKVKLPEGVSIYSFGTGSYDDLINTRTSSRKLTDEPNANDYAAMLFTSGTTGQPKGAPTTHGGLMSNINALADAWAIEPRDRILHILPVFHAHGLFVAAALPLAQGASIILTDSFDAAMTVKLLPEATVLMAVPAIYTRLLQRRDFNQTAARNLRLATSGSAPLSPETFEELRVRLGSSVVERYGLTETIILTSNPIDGTSRVGSVGKPLSGVELRIVGDNGNELPTGTIGRVQAKTPSAIDGYWNRPDLTGDWTEDGFFDTGDLGRVDSDGFIWLVGRKKDLIISGGYNVYPREVEIVLEEITGVAEAAVFGVPHPDFGEGVVAAIRVESKSTITPAEVRSKLSNELTHYKRPKEIILLSALPRNAMGKVIKTQLQETYNDLFS